MRICRRTSKVVDILDKTSQATEVPPVEIDHQSLKIADLRFVGFLGQGRGKDHSPSRSENI
jgi:hypothetical protein